MAQASGSRFRARRHKPRAHFVHIGKTGGSALKAALAPLTTEGSYEIVLHSHDCELRQIPSGDKVFFTVRATLLIALLAGSIAGSAAANRSLTIRRVWRSNVLFGNLLTHPWVVSPSG